MPFTEQLTPSELSPPKGLKLGMPGEHGFYIPDTEAEREVVPEEVQKIRNSVVEFSEAVVAGHNGDINHLTTAENEAWDEIAEIGDTIAEKSGTEVNEAQKDLLASTEAYAAAIKVVKNLSEGQSRVLFVQDAKSVTPILNQMAIERRLSIEASSDQEQKDALKIEFDQILSYAEVLSLLPDSDIVIQDLDNAVASYKSPEEFSKESVNADLETKANAYLAKYASEMSDKILAELPLEEREEPSAEADEQLSRPEKIAQLRDNEVNRVMTNTEPLKDAVAEAKENFLTKYLNKARENFQADQSKENTQTLKMYEADAQGFSYLTQIADKWSRLAEQGAGSPNFQDYLAEELAKAEAEYDQAVLEGGGTIPQDSTENVNYRNARNAYRVGTSKSPYSLERRVTRHAAEKVMTQV